jgi:F-type H+-transporting ATPase subunit delta
VATEVALRYARAFADVAESGNLDPASAQQQLQDLSDTLGESRQLREFFANPSVEMPQKLKVVDALATRLGTGRQVRNFLAVILNHHRIMEFDEIRGEYRKMADSHAGAVEATITSAHALSADQRAELETQVAKLAGAKVRASYMEDPALLGGAVVQIGSTIYDGSVRSQLAQLKQRLVTA